MFFFLSKALDFFIAPIFWVGLFILLSLFSKKSVLKRSYLIASICTIYICSNYAFVNFVCTRWEQPPITLAEHERFDVGIILTGLTDNIRTPRDRIYLKSAAARITTPIILYRKGIVKKILISGGTGSSVKSAQPESEILQQNWILIYLVH